MTSFIKRPCFQDIGPGREGGGGVGLGGLLQTGAWGVGLGGLLQTGGLD